MEQYVNYASTQLIGRCTYNPVTRKANYESFEKYYSNSKNKQFI